MHLTGLSYPPPPVPLLTMEREKIYVFISVNSTHFPMGEKGTFFSLNQNLLQFYKAGSDLKEAPIDLVSHSYANVILS